MGAANRIFADQIGEWVILLVQIACILFSGELDGLTAALLVSSDLVAWVVAHDILTSCNVRSAMLAATIAWRFSPTRPSASTETAPVVHVEPLQWRRDRSCFLSEKPTAASDDEDGAPLGQAA